MAAPSQQPLCKLYAAKWRLVYAEAAVSCAEELHKEPKWLLSLSRAADGGPREGWSGGQWGPLQRLRHWLKSMPKMSRLLNTLIAQLDSLLTPSKVCSHLLHNMWECELSLSNRGQLCRHRY